MTFNLAEVFTVKDSHMLIRDMGLTITLYNGFWSVGLLLVSTAFGRSFSYTFNAFIMIKVVLVNI